jgi:hypothetical protein
MIKPVVLRKVHETGYRGRFRMETPLDPGGVEILANQLLTVPGVIRARVRPNTGSVILETSDRLDEVLALVQENGIASIRGPRAPASVGQSIQMGLFLADMKLKQQSGGAFDLKVAIAAFLIMAAVYQLVQGRIAGPTTTLLMSALSLLEFNKLTGDGQR